MTLIPIQIQTGMCTGHRLLRRIMHRVRVIPLNHRRERRRRVRMHIRTRRVFVQIILQRVQLLQTRPIHACNRRASTRKARSQRVSLTRRNRAERIALPLVQHTLILPQLRRSHAASLRIRGSRHGTRHRILSNRRSLALRSRLFLGRNKRVGLELVDVLHVRRAVAALRVERLHVEMQETDFGPIMKHLMR